MRRFEGQTAVLTGADRGIGLAIATRFVEEGASVALASNRTEVHEAAAALESLIEEQSRPGRVMAVRLDVTSAEEVNAFYAGVFERFGRIDISVQNAGIITIAPLEELSEEAWRRVLDVNTTGVFLCCKAALHYMKSAGHGRLINMASGQARQGFIYTPHYAASKFGVLGLTQSLAREFASAGITVNAICPGIVETDMWQYNDHHWGQLLGDYGPGELIREWVAGVPMKRAAQPREIAGTAAFLASRDADYITGQAINVDGGLIMS
ncbi:MAG: SDR family oxidoreductase [Salinicola sp.]|uniref:SDR family NAD(P)-dependent oxidoreductase n=1 Tax=Salinicola sp. TaxID=1978524 RepID=UPI001D236FC5|nr:SDR family oxidoreductase [Salinicola sp.]NRB55542.1 SDR family oxidoreductase [Salinicola sp.]